MKLSIIMILLVVSLTLNANQRNVVGEIFTIDPEC